MDGVKAMDELPCTLVSTSIKKAESYLGWLGGGESVCQGQVHVRCFTGGNYFSPGQFTWIASFVFPPGPSAGVLVPEGALVMLGFDASSSLYTSCQHCPSAPLN